MSNWLSILQQCRQEHCLVKQVNLTCLKLVLLLLFELPAAVGLILRHGLSTCVQISFCCLDHHLAASLAAAGLFCQEVWNEDEKESGNCVKHFYFCYPLEIT